MVECPSGRGQDQATAVYNLLQSFCIESLVIGVCADTTPSNTGNENGCISLLEELIGKPLLRLLCRKHSHERHIFYAVKAISGHVSKGPSKALYTRFKSEWSKFPENVRQNNSLLSKFPWEQVKDTELY